MRALIQVDERRETMTLFMLIMRATQLYINSLTQIVIQCLFKKLNFSIALETCYGERDALQRRSHVHVVYPKFRGITPLRVKWAGCVGVAAPPHPTERRRSQWPSGPTIWCGAE